MRDQPLRGQTGNIGFVFIPDSASTVGAGKTALTSASAGLNIAVRREKSQVFTAYGGANIGAIATLGTWVNPGTGKVNIKECDATNAPGIYELHFEDAPFSASDTSRKIIGMVQVAGGAPAPFEIPLLAVDQQDGVRFALTALPNVASGSAGAIVTAGSGTGQLNVAGGIGDANVKQLLGTAWLAPGTAGTPDVNAKLIGGAAPASATIGTVSTVTGGATSANQTSILNAVNAITTNTARTGIVVPQFVPIPASGSTAVRVKITLYNLEGVVEDADTNTVTVHASLSDGTSEDVNLSATTATRDSAGQYHVDYNLPSSAAEGGLYIAVTYSVGAVSMAANAVFSVAQADTVTSIAAIKAKTDNLPASPAATGAAMTLTSGERTALANAILDLADAVETGITLRQSQRAQLAALVGKLTTAGANPEVYQNPAGSANRISVANDSAGNRTAVTLTL